VRFAKSTEHAGFRISVFLQRTTDGCGYLWSFNAREIGRRHTIVGDGYAAATRGGAIRDATEAARGAVDRSNARAVTL
jgi:hypothetical protein